MLKRLLYNLITRLTIITLLMNPILIQQAEAFDIAASISGKIGDKVRQALVKSGCKQMGKKGLTGVSGEIGCEALEIGSKTEGVKENLMNIVLMLSMVVSLINTKCALTERGENHLPKSYTAGITHWIHKLAALVYLYADFQNTRKNLQIYQELEAVAEGSVSTQSEALNIQKSAMEEMKASYSEKKGLLKTSATALGAVSAIETGMVAGMIAIGSWRAMGEAKVCSLSKTALASCASPNSPALVNQCKIGTVELIKRTCVDYYKEIDIAGSLIKTGREKAVQMAISQVTSRVSESFENQSAGTKVIAQAATNVASRKSSSYLNNAIQENISFLKDGEGSKNLFGVVDDTMSGKCVKDAINQKVDEWIEEGAVAATVAATAATPAASAAIAKNCGLQTKKEIERCRCMARNIGGVKQAVAIYKQNIVMKDIAEKEKDIPLVPGVDKKEDVCAVDYINWGVRHDLNCVPFLADDKKLDQQDKSAFLSPENIIKMFNAEMNKVLKLDPYMISAYLHQKQKLQLVDYLSQGQHTQEYLTLAPKEKEKVDVAVGALSKAILSLQDALIPSAHASPVKMSNSTELWTELGLNAAGMALLAALYDPVTEVITKLHKTPFRRALLFLTTHSMATANIDQTDNTIADIDKDIKILDEYIKEYEKATTNIFWERMKDFFNPIPSLHAAPKYWPKYERPRVCLQGSSLDPNCECLQGKGKCGYRISFDPNNRMFENKSFHALFMAQASFVKNATHGKVANEVLHNYGRRVAAVAPNMDPVAANRNLNFITKSFGMGQFDLEKASRDLYKELTGYKFKGRPLSIRGQGQEQNLSDSGHSGNSDSFTNGQKKNSGNTLNRGAIKEDGIPIDSFNYENAKVKYKMDDIESNKGMNLFEKISQRYFKVFHQGRLGQE
jgi:hypothetical protein